MSLFNPMYMISRRPAPIDTVGNKYAISDGTRVMEILHLQDMAYELGDPSYRQGNHGQDMLVAYLPKEKLLMNADIYSPPAQGPAPTTPTGSTASCCGRRSTRSSPTSTTGSTRGSASTTRSPSTATCRRAR